MPKAKTLEETLMLHAKRNFKSRDIFYQQAQFMKACGQTVDRYNRKQAALYDDLIVEEQDEFASSFVEARQKYNDAYYHHNPSCADALIDQIVVLIGFGLSMGWPMKKLWDEVMSSNMAKIDPTTGKVKKRRDGKVLKPKDWQPPNINNILLKHSQKKKV